MAARTSSNHSGESLPPPPVHPSLRNAPSSPAAAHGVHRVPPPLPNVMRPRRQQVSEATVVLDEEKSTPGSFGTDESPGTSQDAEEELSEVQLRELYDEEEINRFLQMFSAYVREARVADVADKPPSYSAPEELASSADKMSVGEAEETGDWVSLDQATPTSSVTPPPLPPRCKPDRCLSERIAQDYVLPLLPPARPEPPSFTLHRLRVSVQRIYLATIPFYGHLLSRLIQLATWKEKNISLVYCAAYWILWYSNLLLPALVLRILFALIRRKLLPYPNLEELRRHRRQVDDAEEFSANLISRFVQSPPHDAQDVYKIFRDFYRSRKMKKASSLDAQRKAMESLDQDAVAIEADVDEEDTLHQSDPASSHESDVKRSVLAALNEVADMHERTKNIFLWRRPALSVMYGMAIFALLIVSLLPAWLLVKLSGFVVGVVFWHVMPIVTAIPPEERARFPKPFEDVPTDAEYAMELISQRVARGLEIKPKKSRPKATPKQTLDSGSASPDADGIELSTQSVGSSSSSTSVDWKKWGDRVATTKATTDEVKNMFKNGQWKRPESWLSLNPLSPKIALPSGSAEPRVQTYTFPAQHAKASGLITLTSDTLHFTSLVSSTAKLSIPLASMLGVKKAGALRGLNVRWAHTSEDGLVEEREEKFMWVGARNELFARLVAWGGRRWANV
ncbi:uncharacterized protein LAESUDRAFT_729938 [Laetiporus sulphureus 93-53]|uniref:Uncharacterized protein n=1 Tax=Laetiporus sulphureus 93-53 TaxID=1314785 RepID=A0A165CEZ2_9APHY|nr:uncharacterized protein LAESUDRAFT_729938 [Laetiporus sulphureus 93-53]KZT02693.1 hypothetical protein LAESUDRAFT_729938 [Laetiporus sulphureus 93-53]